MYTFWSPPIVSKKYLRPHHMKTYCVTHLCKLFSGVHLSSQKIFATISFIHSFIHPSPESHNINYSHVLMDEMTSYTSDSDDSSSKTKWTSYTSDSDDSFS